MRRQEKEVSDPALLEVWLQEAKICRIGLTGSDGPYVVPVNFGYEAGSLYFHSAREGRKISWLRNDNRVCFEAEAEAELIRGIQACRYGMRYRSVIGFGKAFFLETAREKIRGLDIILRHYAPQEVFSYPEADVASVSVIQIKIESITGKKSG